MNTRKDIFDREFKEAFGKFLTEYYGKRCLDHDPGCPICNAWDNFADLFNEIESGDDVYEYKIKALNFFNKRKLDEMSAEGWNVCASTFVPNLTDMIGGVERAANTIFYFKRKL